MRIKKSPYTRSGLAMIGLLSLCQIAIGFFLIMGTNNPLESVNIGDIDHRQEIEVSKPAFKISFLHNEAQQ